MLVVTGGPTSAGTRRVKEHSSWSCLCYGKRVETTDLSVISYPREHLGTTYSCPDCGERRPDAS